MKNDIDIIREYWDSGADSWNDLIESGKDYYKDKIIAPAMLELIPGKVQENEKALDLCCGEGFYSRKLKERGYDVSGVDVSSELINIAKSKDGAISYICSDAGDLSFFDSNYFDLVLCGMGLMDAPNYEDIIKEAYRVLKPNAHFVFSISHPCFSFEKAGNWERDANGEKLFFKMDNYFVEDAKEVDWNWERLKYHFKIKTYHRTLSTYYNFLADSGFIVERLVEPFPQGSDVDERFQDSSRVAYFLMMKCRKQIGMA